jgi:amino acid adenylation domain-containing protein
VSDGARRQSYRELNQRANQVAHHLLARGVLPEEPVGLYLERSAEMLVGLLGILKAGAAYVPLDASSPAGRLELLLPETRVRLVLTQEHLRARLPAGVTALCLDEASTPLALAPTEDPPSRVGGSHLAYVMYTSGSTGRPKGVMVTQEGLAHYVTWALRAYRVEQGSGAPLHGSLAFDATLTSLLPPLLAGKEVVVIPEHAPLDALATGLRGRPGWSVLKITPAHLKVLESLLPATTLSRSVHTVVIGGEALSSDVLGPWHQHSPGVTFVNEYGPTETVVGCCVHSVPEGGALPANIPIGKPLPYTRLYLLDDGLQHVPVGMVGDLYIGGAGVARGYFDRPDLTAASFIPDPWSEKPGERLYKTGDLARRMADGTLLFLGRRDAQVKIRGYRVELGEIQSRLATHPAVEACHVATRAGSDGEPVLVAYIVNRSPAPIPAEELTRHLVGTLPGYMVPTHFVCLPALPLTENGKVDQRALPAPRPPAPDKGSREPRSDTEKALAALWRRMLDVEQVGTESNFFELGGHSLLAGQLIARIREHFGIEVPLLTIFDAPTLGHLAARIDRERNGTSCPAAGSIQRRPRVHHRAVRDADGGISPLPDSGDKNGGHHG